MLSDAPYPQPWNPTAETLLKSLATVLDPDKRYLAIAQNALGRSSWTCVLVPLRKLFES